MTAQLDIPFQTSKSTRRRTTIVILGTALFAAALALAPTGILSSASAAPVGQCNDAYNADASQVECSVQVENTIDLNTNVASSVVTVIQCIGAPAAAICGAPVVTNFTELTSTVTQCNGSANSGGGVVLCSVVVTNNITGAANTTPATLNQCAGSGAGGGALPLLCDNYATTTGATITQCNGSVNGGGAPARVSCTVGPSTAAAEVPILINQCNGSANGGGARMVCSARVINLGDDVVYTGPDLSSINPTLVAAVGPIEDVTPVPTDVGVPAPIAVNNTLAATGTDLMLPVLFGLAALTVGGGLSLAALLNRRKVHLHR